ncbi:hypothetical protein FOC33_15525 [Plesiomonas shigelloides]|uniref:hypothetical protein n=1 Tax=Plesiomonas shigelloides TaxID=703 RepID=UPI0011BE1358|nr:hypothetical protein [Plesiomonas shigelloides]QIY10189.1 hypothetical protein FOC33_15525 [Plesiomonas shigelloides]
MTKLTWSIDELSTLGRVYLRNVLGKMRGFEHSHTQFGRLGKGIKPNYQVTFPNGIVRCFRGINHEDAGREGFEEQNISQPFSLADVKEAFEKAACK